MLYLHTLSPPIVHRDIKSPNLLVDKAWTVKVSGESRRLAGTQEAAMKHPGGNVQCMHRRVRACRGGAWCAGLHYLQFTTPVHSPTLRAYAACPPSTSPCPRLQPLQDLCC